MTSLSKPRLVTSSPRHRVTASSPRVRARESGCADALDRASGRTVTCLHVPSDTSRVFTCVRVRVLVIAHASARVCPCARARGPFRRRTCLVRVSSCPSAHAPTCSLSQNRLHGKTRTDTSRLGQDSRSLLPFRLTRTRLALRKNWRAWA
jgi:hypothetical protein